VIDERMEEQASLYALGALEGDELRAFETALRQDPELQKLVAALRDASDVVAGDAPLMHPPAGLKQKILDEIDRREKIVPLTSSPTVRAQPVNWFAWALAACFMVLCAWLANQQKLSERRHAAETAQLQQTIATLESATNDLRQVVADLAKRNEMMSLQVAVLESLVPDSKAVAVTLWDERKQNGVLVAQKLQTLPNDKDYQLWVIDPAQSSPIDAGVFKVDSQGNMRAAFTPKSSVKAAGKFAVTVERKGGAPKPEGKMVLIGG